MRPKTPARWLAIALLALVPTSVISAKPPYFDDAALNAVQFLDKNTGWAVGEDGVIWHTGDAGKTWQRQSSGVGASLRSVHFLDKSFGWAVGREEMADGQSIGVLLQTSDGGRKWRRLLDGSLPGLNLVRFANEKVGYIAGDGARQYPTGVFVTVNGGRNWKPLEGPRCTSWYAGAFDATGRGALGGAWNRLASARADRIIAIDHDPLGGRNIRGMHFQGGLGFAVGQGGLVLVSKKTGGSSWSFPTLPFRSSVKSCWDFHSIHGVGKKLWAVGRPGSAVLHSSNLGETWEVMQTGQPLPLNGVHFVDEKNGWAVGELGTILRTADGGKTWKLVKRGGQRVAVLFLHARAKNVPFETVAHLGGQEGYLTASVCVTSPDSESATVDRSTEHHRLTAAMRRSTGSGGEMLWEFPFGEHLVRGSKPDLLKAWDKLHGGETGKDMVRQLILALRMWRPSVVVTDNPDPLKADNLAEAMLVQALREAVQHASDKKVFPEHFLTFGLEPWSPSKLYAVCDDPKIAQVRVDAGSISTELLASPRDYATRPTALVNASGRPPRIRAFRLLAGAGDAMSHRRLMQGIDHNQGGLARRAITNLDKPDQAVLDAVKKTAQLSAMVENESTLTSPDRLLGTLGSSLEKMPMDQAAKAAHLVGIQLARAGHWMQAREVFALLVKRYPVHPLSVDAYRWLIQHNSSSEVRRRYDLNQFVLLREQAHGQKQGSNVVRAGFTKPKGAEDDPGVKQLNFPRVGNKETFTLSYQIDPVARKKWFEDCLELGEQLGVHGAIHSRDPAVAFSLQSVRRRLGKGADSQKWYEAFAARCSGGAWRDAAISELWYNKRLGVPPRPVTHCRLTETRPFLDGILEDECWKQAKPLRMSNVATKATPLDIDKADSKTNAYPTEVRMAYDKEFLYLAIRCFHPAGMQQPKATPRQHDTDMTKFDRVSLMLDLDRDYSTYFHFQVDQRGCVADDCWGDKGWNPRWFVATRSEARVWVVEAAIPMAGLTGDNIHSGQAWACNVIRVVPGKGVHSFSKPTGVPEEKMHPEGMGLMMFLANGKLPLKRPPVGRREMPPAR